MFQSHCAASRESHTLAARRSPDTSVLLKSNTFLAFLVVHPATSSTASPSWVANFTAPRSASSATVSASADFSEPRAMASATASTPLPAASTPACNIPSADVATVLKSSRIPRASATSLSCVWRVVSSVASAMSRWASLTAPTAEARRILLVWHLDKEIGVEHEIPLFIEIWRALGSRMAISNDDEVAKNWPEGVRTGDIVLKSASLDVFVGRQDEISIDGPGTSFQFAIWDVVGMAGGKISASMLLGRDNSTEEALWTVTGAFDGVFSLSRSPRPCAIHS
ncbi:hypothetical protein C8A05DRAFT_30804 [Staphylotrichum tortipilum]|uniref:Uncharacterized protein n=1 Tax=Staphylotrichum tortipilum TaxID=2831512 RepID=A0AAN6MQU1_9PEZI|nr:hypothetical protein C8A05DRAFT_30804 [Staphylotrichum longicolle]